jgi:CubicO group peptidase (beta-lactamase class C family)
VGAAVREGGHWRFGFGVAGRLRFEGDAPAASLETVFDLASLTKPVTALALARMERAGSLSRRTLVGDVLPALSSTKSARVPLDLLAAHRAGLGAHQLLFEPLTRGVPVDFAGALVTAADARRPDSMGEPPSEGFAPLYSDLGYLVLGAAMAASDSEALDRIMVREVAEPLGLTIGSARTLRARNASFDVRVAPTEIVDWRGGLVRGAVHDDNAWALVRDGAAGHAGLFGDVASIVALGTHILDARAGRADEWLRSVDMMPLVANRPGGSLLAGFDRRSGEVPSSGSRLGPNTFGHLGFTGTSIWMDPDLELVGVLLTNRVHPSRASDAIRRARPAAYDAMFDAMRAAG